MWEARLRRLRNSHHVYGFHLSMFSNMVRLQANQSRGTSGWGTGFMRSFLSASSSPCRSSTIAITAALKTGWHIITD